MKDEVQITSESEERGNRKRRVILGIQAIAAFAIIILFVRSVWPSPSLQVGTVAPPSNSGGGPKSTTSAQANVPQKLGGLSLVSADVGQQAIEGMAQLHGKDVGIVDGWIGRYQAGGVVWVGQATGEQVAASLLAAMAARIAAANGPFRDLRAADLDGQRLYSVTGQGRTHYFFQKGDKVIWLTLPASGADAFLRDALRSLN